MSLLKTIPSIQSTRETGGSRRRSSLLGGRRFSAFQSTSIDLNPSLKRFAKLMPFEAMGFLNNDPLMVLHVKNADT